MDRMQELANLLVLQEFMQNQIQFTDEMINTFTDINIERSRLSPEEALEWRKTTKGDIGNLAEILCSVDSDDSYAETSQDEQRTGKRRAVRQNRTQESEDVQLLQDEIKNLLNVKPLSEEERAELEYLRQKYRNLLLKSAEDEGLEQHIEKCMHKVLSNARKRKTPRPEQKQTKGDVLCSETAAICLKNRRSSRNLRKSVQFYLGEEEIQHMIQEAREKDKAEQKRKERIKKKKELRMDRERERQRAVERLKDSERWMQMEEAFEEMNRSMHLEIAKLKQELEIEKDRKKKATRQAKKWRQFLEERVKLLEQEIEEIKRNSSSTSNLDVEDGMVGVAGEIDGNMQEARAERKTQAKRQTMVEMEQRKQQEALDNEETHFSSAPFQGSTEYYLGHTAVDYSEDTWQYIKRRVINLFVWIWKGLRRVGSALSLIYDFFHRL